VKRRPSVATVIALLALFVALGGPAEAARVVKRVTSADVKDHSIKTRDLSRKTVSQLKTPRTNSVTEAKIVNGAVTRAKLGLGAVSSPAIADRSIAAADLGIGSVNGATIADGSLTARELGRFYGRFRLAQPIMVEAGTCWSGVPSNLAAEQATVDISQDLVIVTPDSSWPEKTLTFMVKVEPPQPKPGRFTLSACNVTNQDSATFTPSFRYLIVDLP
jgi:hypothetical protein